MLFPVMLHRVLRMSALSLIFQELNLVGISQGFHQHKVSADTSLPVGNGCDAAPWCSAALSGNCLLFKSDWRYQRSNLSHWSIRQWASHATEAPEVQSCAHAGARWAEVTDRAWQQLWVRGSEYRQKDWRRRIPVGSPLQEVQMHRNWCSVKKCVRTEQADKHIKIQHRPRLLPVQLLPCFSTLCCGSFGSYSFFQPCKKTESPFSSKP